MKYALINSLNSNVENVGYTDNPNQQTLDPYIIVFSEDEYEVGWMYADGLFYPPNE